ncbi:unnamed protein product [Acanthoscelides obtectus]|uniref:TRASH domain-containing protein n=1 Tax=Acanthoscelides obtectus TaxID=200917 RepID=A0A9P0PEW9_ACAOB|nr:unnamed protein product [Acanthoscelides obtectus]CAK1628282.1 Zinc finger MYM-type protein 3 [Acanthoscelides obtectus]
MENFEDHTFQSFQTIAPDATNVNYSETPDTSTEGQNVNADHIQNNTPEESCENPKSASDLNLPNTDDSNIDKDMEETADFLVKNSEVNTSIQTPSLTENIERIEYTENMESLISSTEDTTDNDNTNVEDSIENTVAPSVEATDSAEHKEEETMDVDGENRHTTNYNEAQDVTTDADSSRPDIEENQASQEAPNVDSTQDADSPSETPTNKESSEISSCVEGEVPTSAPPTEDIDQRGKIIEEENTPLDNSKADHGIKAFENRGEDAEKPDDIEQGDEIMKPSSTEPTPMDDDTPQNESSQIEETNVEDMETTSSNIAEPAEDSEQAKDNDVDAEISTSTTSTEDKEKEKSDENQSEEASASETISTGENTEFVQVNSETDSQDTGRRSAMEDDPIASDSFDAIGNDDREGADEELCIIPDTEREISQAEKDAASTIPPLRDISAATTEAIDSTIDSPASTDSIIVYKHDKEHLEICNKCKLKRKALYYYSQDEEINYICDDNCLSSFKESYLIKVVCNWEEGGLRVKNFTSAIKDPSFTFIRKCASCDKVTDDIENNLTWEIMDFCDELCLTKYQKEIGSHCATCKEEVKSNSLGKYCVRFGNDIRQFCTSFCLEKYKKGLKVCSYCQQDMSGEPKGFLAPVGDKGQFKDFCSQICMEKYDIMTNDRPPKVAPGTICSVCKGAKPITIELDSNGTPNYFCGEPCFVAFSFVNKISSGKCAMCKRNFSKEILKKYTMCYDNVQNSFCSNSCKNIYIIAHRKIVPCSWCKVKKYNFDMIRRYSKTEPMINMCSVNCLDLYRTSLDSAASCKVLCNYCQKMSDPVYHLSMSDGSVRNFCGYNCVSSFQSQFPKQSALPTVETGFPVPTGIPRRNKRFPIAAEGVPVADGSSIPVISSVQSLSCTNGTLIPQCIPLNTVSTRSTRSKSSATTTAQLPQITTEVQVQIKHHFIVRSAPLPEQRNVSTMCYTKKTSQGTMMKPEMVDQGVQTDEREAAKILIPCPVPIYVPTPMHVFSAPSPVPVPIPIPIPIPIFIPTTRNSAQGIMKEIKKIQVKIPTDPYEAELLMMAEMVAEEKKDDVTDSESDIDDGGPEDSYSPEPVEASNTFGDDMLQMALKMATELEEPAVDLEGALTANTITAPQDGHGQEEGVDEHHPMHQHMMDRNAAARGRKRGIRQNRGGSAPKRGRRMSHQVDMPMMQQQQPPPQPEPVEKPDANMCLKYTFGVNAWKQWVTTKNTELEKSSRRCKLFKTEILQLTSDELSYSLCLFVKEVRKPNGAEYAPDTIYYLCLGIQQYLFENGRIDNIFCDPYYEKFTDCLDEVAKKFSVLYNDSHYIVTRVEEEHLWESKQLGAHSPHVLLSTLMFFNTKHFNLTTVEEHMQLSFSHIMKHWKRNPNQPGASTKLAGTRNVLLRFYPPQSAIQNNARKKKVYEQQENEENPLRCPVKLYEFYLSKCPESVRTRNDVFYLQPERSCVPDSPVWYSTMPLPKEALEKMLHRVKMVKEINVALLTS